ncbi:MAG: helix-turn-helix domain-containing protein [Bacteroidota bacterium]|nr:helix-turn-helix domain-containing protein [Bacteroidota bacterium]
MDQQKAKRLRSAGWKVGDTSDFLELSPEELEFIEFRLALAQQVKALRLAKGLTQMEMAKAIGSSQSRVAKLEAGDASVSTDLMLRTFFSLGAKRKDLPGGSGRRATRSRTADYPAS